MSMYMYNCMIIFFRVASYDNYRSCVLEDNSIGKSPLKISAPIREKKKVMFLFAHIVDFTSHKLWAQDVPSSGSKVSSNAERHFKP